MPKEYTHWCLAEKTRRSLEKRNPELAKLIFAYHHVFLIGAVAPDILFYYSTGPVRELFRNCAVTLHGNRGFDTLHPLSYLLAADDYNPTPAALAFLCGYATHVAVDSNFHPLVYYYVGLDRREHHAFESILDLYFQSSESLPNHGLMFESLLRAELPAEQLHALIGEVLFRGEKYPSRELSACLRWYGRSQKMFWKPKLALAVSLLALLKKELKPFVTSFYLPRFRNLAARFAEPVTFRHPVKGKEMTTSIAELSQAALSDALFYLEGLERSRQEKKPLPVGPNMHTGIRGVELGEMVYRSARGCSDLFDFQV